MSITSGFYNSLNGDRRYNADQMSAIFDGIINDGVLANVGDAFAVTTDVNNVITIGTGRAWFNSTWVYNDATLSLTLPELTGDGLRSNYHVANIVVLEVDRRDAVRAATVKFTEAFVGNSSYTVDSVIEYALDKLVNTDEVHQYPLAAIYRKGGTVDAITQSNIYNYVGTSYCPFVTGILQVQSIDNIVARWESEFETWFASVQATLNDDVATSLTREITAIKYGVVAVGDANKLGGHEASYYGPAEHTHDASKVTAGTLGDKVLANETAVSNLAAKQVRNIYAGTADMTAGTSALPTGDIYVVYE
jgi:hypothetical protein